MHLLVLYSAQVKHILLPETESLQASLESSGWEALETMKELCDANIYPTSANDNAYKISQYHVPGSGMLTHLCRQW